MITRLSVSTLLIEALLRIKANDTNQI